jgi:myo-inositol 2-dehydrogenase/D-chiro-inositol 1-dehydrogenase
MTSVEDNVSFPSGQRWPDFWRRFHDAYVEEMNAFVEMASGSIPSPCTASDALAALLIAEAADLSMREGRRVRLEEVAK